MSLEQTEKFSSQTVRKVIELYKNDKKVPTIAKETGLTKNQIRGLITRLCYWLELDNRQQLKDIETDILVDTYESRSPQKKAGMKVVRPEDHTPTNPFLQRHPAYIYCNGYFILRRRVVNGRTYVAGEDKIVLDLNSPEDLDAQLNKYYGLKHRKKPNVDIASEGRVLLESEPVENEETPTTDTLQERQLKE